MVGIGYRANILGHVSFNPICEKGMILLHSRDWKLPGLGDKAVQKGHAHYSES